MEISEIDAIDSSPHVWPAEPTSRAQVIDDPIMAAAASVAVIHQMQRTLGEAMDSDQLELIDILIKYGHNSDGVPALHYAIKMQDEKAVELLLNHGADPRALSMSLLDVFLMKDGYHYPAPILPLEFAAIIGNIKIMQLLIAKGADVNQKILGKLHNEYLEVQDVDRLISPLFFAAREGHDEAIRFLLANGAKLKTLNDNQSSAFSPLAIATLMGHIKVLRAFIENGINIAEHPSLLHCAASNGHGEIVKLLLDSGVYVDIHQGDWTALMMAKGSCVEILLNAGANPKAITSTGLDVVYFSASRCDLEATRALLKHGVDLNINTVRENGYPRTLFQTACEQSGNHPIANVKEYLHLLLDNGADINARCNGKTALGIAKSYKNQDLISWLIAHGAKD